MLFKNKILKIIIKRLIVAFRPIFLFGKFLRNATSNIFVTLLQQSLDSKILPIQIWIYHWNDFFVH